MASFRRKPVVVDAERWSYGVEQQTVVLEWLDSHGAEWFVTGDDLIINTPEGDMRASPNDWIIRGVAGEFCPCKPDTFHATHEATVQWWQRGSRGD